MIKKFLICSLATLGLINGLLALSVQPETFEGSWGKQNQQQAIVQKFKSMTEKPALPLEKELSKPEVKPKANAELSMKADVVTQKTSGGEDSLPILPPGGVRAVTNLKATVDCSKTEPRRGSAQFSWTVAKEPGSAQRVDVTIYDFEGDKFESSELLAADQSSLEWKQLRGQAIHLWRVLTSHADGWVPSETARFEGPTCVADFAPKPNR